MSNTVANHPTGIAAFAVTVLIWVAGIAGLTIPTDVAVAIVGLAAAAVSAFTPRRIEVVEDPYTGPDTE